MHFLFFILALLSACDWSDKPKNPVIPPTVTTTTTTTATPVGEGKESKVETTTTTKPADGKHPKVKPEPEVETINLPTGDGGAMEAWTVDEACASGTAQFFGHKHECQAVDAARAEGQLVTVSKGHFTEPDIGMKHGRHCAQVYGVGVGTRVGEESFDLCGMNISPGEERGKNTVVLMNGDQAIRLVDLTEAYEHARGEEATLGKGKDLVTIRCIGNGTHAKDGTPYCAKMGKVAVEAATPAADAIKETIGDKPNKD